MIEYFVKKVQKHISGLNVDSFIIIFIVNYYKLNFLAHIYLSGSSDEIKIGNFIGDYVKGRNYEKYPELVRKGIILHRKIDSFTDSHPIVNQSKMHLKKRFRRYSGVIVDIFMIIFWLVNGICFQNIHCLSMLSTCMRYWSATILYFPMR
jgi:acyl carrier protein phosphodiesterase